MAAYQTELNLFLNYSSASGPYAMVERDVVIVCDTSSAGVTVNLLSAASTGSSGRSVNKEDWARLKIKKPGEAFVTKQIIKKDCFVPFHLFIKAEEKTDIKIELVGSSPGDIISGGFDIILNNY
jgi:hypothetical protein